MGHRNYEYRRKWGMDIEEAVVHIYMRGVEDFQM